MTTSLPWFRAENPLIIASSGGNGHISAAQSLIQQFLQYQKTLPYHTFPKASKKLGSFEFLLLKALKYANNPLVKKIHPKLTLPNSYQLKKAKIQLIKQQDNQPQRFYIDFLLDWLPHGLIYAALFNLLQSQGQGQSLKAVTRGQKFLDSVYRISISQKIYSLLIQAIEKGEPFDTVISTQALGIPGLLDGIRRYNQDKKQLEKTYQRKLPELRFHQFVTDIPEASAEHFLKPLQKLKPSEKKYLSIHLLDLNKRNIFEEQNLADEIYVYPPEQHPIVREELRRSKHNQGILGFNYFICQKQSFFIKPKQKLAVLMLSSGQGPNSIHYIKHLVNKGIEHIAVVGKIDKQVSKAIHQLKKTSHIYLLGHLDAKDLAKILSASHYLIIKGGGLSLMELASLKLRKDAQIFIHQPTPPIPDEKAQALVWEEGNIEWFLNYCHQNQKIAYITNPETIINQL